MTVSTNRRPWPSSRSPSLLCELEAKAHAPLPEYVYLITLVKFHPTNPDRLATGGADGLINVFDVSQESEDDALLTALNPGVSSVRSLTWFQRKNDTEALAAISDDEELVSAISCSKAAICSIWWYYPPINVSSISFDQECFYRASLPGSLAALCWGFGWGRRAFDKGGRHDWHPKENPRMVQTGRRTPSTIRKPRSHCSSRINFPCGKKLSN